MIVYSVNPEEVNVFCIKKIKQQQADSQEDGVLKYGGSNK
jgi:hypothetical protein